MAALRRLGIVHPVIQAPMAGTSTPNLAAAVSNAGGLGSISIATLDPDAARDAIRQVRAMTSKPFNVNLFCHTNPTNDVDRERAWIDHLRPTFEHFGAAHPTRLRSIYESFLDNGPMTDMLIDTSPPIISFHFGVPRQDTVRRLQNAGSILVATATSLEEARVVQEAGIDYIVAQGYEAGGHRGIFNPDGPDEKLSTLVLTRLLVNHTRMPVISAGGIMDGQGIAACLKLGAVAAQLGTAFIACPESSADGGYRKALAMEGAQSTRVTRIISGRPARCIENRFTALEDCLAKLRTPDYPLTYDIGKALNAAAKVKGEDGFGAQWAGQGASMIRILPAKELIETLVSEL